MRSIALANQKGGVGKTTTAIHLGHGLSLLGARVLVADLDPQGNATVALQNMRPVEDQHEVGESRCVGPDFWVHSAFGHSQGEPSSDLLDAIWKDVDRIRADWLIVDCPPRMDAWGRAGLALCQEVLVPVQAEFLAMHGLSQIMATIDATEGRCSLLGVLATMVDGREQISLEVVSNLRAHLGDRVLETVILRDPTVIEAASHGKTVFAHAPASKAALCFGELTREVQ